jgi:hypothetical protein
LQDGDIGPSAQFFRHPLIDGRLIANSSNDRIGLVLRELAEELPLTRT